MPADADTRMKALEGELSLLKNQVQQTLLDIREHVLEFTNPFTAEARLVRAWQERTAQAAQTNLNAGAAGASEAVEQLLDADQSLDSFDAVPEPEPASEPVETDTEYDLSPVDLLDDLDAGEVPDIGVDELEPDEFSVEEYETAEADPGPAPADDWIETREAPSPQSDYDLEDRSTAPAEQPPPAEAPPPEATDEAESPGMDLIMLVSLVRWVDQNIQRIGKDRVEVILDIYEMSGRITGDTKDLVKRLCALDRDDDDSRVPVRDVVSAMLTMDGVLDDKAPQSQRLLGLMFDDTFNGFPTAGNGLLR